MEKLRAELERWIAVQEDTQDMQKAARILRRTVAGEESGQAVRTALERMLITGRKTADSAVWKMIEQYLRSSFYTPAYYHKQERQAEQEDCRMQRQKQIKEGEIRK